jgi:hypothetical protein
MISGFPLSYLNQHKSDSIIADIVGFLNVLDGFIVKE